MMHGASSFDHTCMHPWLEEPETFFGAVRAWLCDT
jgi:hypothetical protein